jgi:hypothetical protein
MKNPEFSLLDFVNSEIPLKDKYWFVINKCDLTYNQKREIAIGVSSIVLVIYENKYPNDDRPRKAIEAAKKYLNNEISIKKLKLARSAAYAAAAYAADAYAADAYAYAADAADAAAYAAADAAYAAADAADADAAYAYDAAYAAAYAAAAAADDYQQLLLDFLINYINNA